MSTKTVERWWADGGWSDEIVVPEATPDLTEAKFSHMAYVRRFGSLSQAQEAAGLSVNPVGWPKA